MVLHFMNVHYLFNMDVFLVFWYHKTKLQLVT